MHAQSNFTTYGMTSVYGESSWELGEEEFIEKETLLKTWLLLHDSWVELWVISNLSESNEFIQIQKTITERG